MKLLSRVRFFATPWTVAYQAPPSMEFSRQEYWSGLPFPSPGDLPDPGMKEMPKTKQNKTKKQKPPKPTKHLSFYTNPHLFYRRQQGLYNPNCLFQESLTRKYNAKTTSKSLGIWPHLFLFLLICFYFCLSCFILH